MTSPSPVSSIASLFAIRRDRARARATTPAHTSPRIRIALVAAGLCALSSVTLADGTAATYSVLHAFTGGNDGMAPDGGLVIGSDGNLYGTAAHGGGPANDGIVYMLTPAGALTILHSFTGGDGAAPEAGLVQGPDGNFYGTTTTGGSGGDGTAFKITPDGTLTTLHGFSGRDGKIPTGRLTIGPDGNLYGCTQKGGTHRLGEVFKMTPAGRVTVLYSFDGTDGEYPTGDLAIGADGNFYGTTTNGGGATLFYGTVFKITPAGAFTLLHQFGGEDASDGSNPNTGLTLGSDGNFYGTTLSGGSADGGTVYRMTPAGAVTVLHSFSFGRTGTAPFAGLVQAADGKFYGATANGTSGGVIFSITSAGRLAIVHALNEATDGVFPESTLVQGSDGTLYGTTTGDGTSTATDGNVYAVTLAN